MSPEGKFTHWENTGINVGELANKICEAEQPCGMTCEMSAEWHANANFDIFFDSKVLTPILTLTATLTLTHTVILLFTFTVKYVGCCIEIMPHIFTKIPKQYSEVIHNWLQRNYFS
jgi:hypothetical protein